MRKFALVLSLVIGALLLQSVLAVLALRYFTPWTTAFIVEARVASWFDDDPRPWKLQRKWRDLDAISPQLQLAVIASEDQRHALHALVREASPSRKIDDKLEIGLPMVIDFM